MNTTMLNRRLDRLDNPKSSNGARQWFVAQADFDEGMEHLVSILPDHFRPEIDEVFPVQDARSGQFRDCGDAADFWDATLADIAKNGKRAVHMLKANQMNGKHTS